MRLKREGEASSTETVLLIIAGADPLPSEELNTLPLITNSFHRAPVAQSQITAF